MTPPPEITAIVCTHNRECYLAQCIISLLNQSLKSVKYEILVVDNCSTDGTRGICSQFKYQSNFRYVFEPVAGLSKARNTGWKHAKSCYIGYIDDDATADTKWLERALWSLENIVPSPDGLTGPISLDCEVDLPNWLKGEFQVTLGKLDWGEKAFPISYAKEKIVGANCFFTKKILSRLGGFNEDLGRKKKMLLSGEETQFQRKVEASGGIIWYHPDVSVKHFVPTERTSPAWFYKRYYWEGITNFFMNKSLENFSRNSTDGLKSFFEIESRLNQVKRFSKNTLWSFGSGPSLNEKIWGRIYLSYCIGYLMGVAKYWQKLKLQ